MAKYLLEIQSRALYVGPTEQSFSELFDLNILADFADDTALNNDLNIEVISDLSRFNESGEYFANQQFAGNIPEGDYGKIRHSVQIVPQCGFFGNFYGYDIQKNVPADGNFKFFGVRGNCNPIPADPEFVAGLGTINDGWLS